MNLNVGQASRLPSRRSRRQSGLRARDCALAGQAGRLPYVAGTRWGRAGSGARCAHRVRRIVSLRFRERGKAASISRSLVSCAGIFSFTALLMLPGTSAGGGLAKADERLSAPVDLSAEGFKDESLSHDSPRNSPQTTPSRDERSEEHTSELQSLAYLVCRLLLEKKKKKP